jgi:UDPglucose 6-dehydrogenase
VASNPEFLREGTAVRDFLEPSRIVIGCDDPQVAVRVSELYRGVHAPLVVTDAASAEMIKYASNAFLATKISFINAVANLCEALDADVRDVALGMGYDNRIGSEFLHPGPGYGGSCFPKDVAALIHAAEHAGYDFSLLDAVVDVNERQHARIVDKVQAAVGGNLAGKPVAVWGLTFKANTDDLRDSPALEIAGRLLAAGARVRAFDPAADERAQTAVAGLEVVADPYDACAGAEVLAVLTEWDQFRWLDFDRVAATMARPIVVDARNLLDASALRHRGFQYVGVGR